MQVGIVQSVADRPSTLGEFIHEVLVDGEAAPRQVLGCDLQPFPELDEDLRVNRPNVHIQNSNVANLNLGSQVGTINAVLDSISGMGNTQQEFAVAIKELTEAAVSPETALTDTQRQEFVDVLATIAEQGAKPPEQRATGVVKAAVKWIPTAISAASNLVSLWDKLGPTILRFLGV
jgi:hypothetical protein